MQRSLSVLGLFAFAACTAGGPPTHPKPSPDAPVIATGEAPPGNAPGRNTAASVSFAPSPLTDLAKALTTLAVTVLDGNPPPPGPIAIEHVRSGKKLVRSEGALPKGSDLEFFLFGIQMYAILDEGPDPNTVPGSAGPPRAEDGSIRITGLVGGTGYRVVDLSARSARKSQRLPGWLMGSVQSCNETVEALRGGRINSLFITEADRPLFKNDDLFARAMNELPKPERVREVEDAVKKHPRVLGVEVDDLYLVAREKSDTTGQFFYAFEFNVDEDDGQLVLDSSPLMEVEKRDTKAHPSDDDVSPAPPPPPPAPPPPPRR